MKVLIVEDELILAITYSEMLKTMGILDVRIEPKMHNAQQIILSGDTDVVILDINLGGGMEGIELAAICKQEKIPFIYISSYSDKATLDLALKNNPGAYLFKPITEGTLYTTFQIIKEQQKSRQKCVLEFKQGTELVLLPLEKLLYLKAENVYVNVIATEKNYLYRGSLASLMEKLPEGSLIQTHRSFAVNPAQINRVSASSIFIGTHEIPISRNFKGQVFMK